MSCEVAVVGGGPAGLAFATWASRAGLQVVVLERGALPRDKACGEGLLPAGVAELEALGVRERLAPSGCSPIHAIRWIGEDGSSAEARLPSGGGLGIRRTALSAALLEAARAAGAEVKEGTRVLGLEPGPDAMRVLTAGGALEAKLVVAADGLHSPLRREMGLERKTSAPLRFGMRQHFGVQSWPPRVEVHFAPGVEAYVTPCGPGQVGVALLWEPRAIPGARYLELLHRFPRLQAQLEGSTALSELAAAGPLYQRSRRLVAGRFALLGDAGGYVDALSGEGVSLALRGARLLAGVAKDALAPGGGTALRAYERRALLGYARYFVVTRALLALARSPPARRATLRALGRSPRGFSALVAAALG